MSEQTLNNAIKIIDNTTGAFLSGEIHKAVRGITSARFAAAFFTSDTLLRQTHENNAVLKIHLLICLNAATSPTALAAALKDHRIQIRYFTGRTFHAKLYIFGDKRAITGSSNITDGGLQVNREVNVLIPSAYGDAFDRVVQIFETYWGQAAPLDSSKLSIFTDIYNRARPIDPELDLSAEIEKRLGAVHPQGIRRSGAKKSKAAMEWTDYEKTFQAFEHGFNEVTAFYEKAMGSRLTGGNAIPLHIEVQAFMSYVREQHLKDDAPPAKRDAREIEAHVMSLVAEWRQPKQHKRYIDLAEEQYETLRAGLSRDRIGEMSVDGFFSLLLDNVNAVRTRLRYFQGGEPVFRKAFLKNSEERVRTMLRHLTDVRVGRFQRLHDCIFDPAYKLDNLSRSGVQELYAWLSHDGTPICNSRTERVLQWFGYDVVVHDRGVADLCMTRAWLSSPVAVEW